MSTSGGFMMHVGEKVDENLSISIENPDVLMMSPDILNTPRCTHGIPRYTHGIPRRTHGIPRCTEHTLYRVGLSGDFIIRLTTKKL